MWEYASKLELMDEVTKKSKMTEKDALEIGRKVDAALASKYERKVGRRSTA